MRSGRARTDVSVYVLNMGQPVKILDLAERMIRLSGLEPGRDIQIVFTGIRPGERLNEILFTREEEANSGHRHQRHRRGAADQPVARDDAGLACDAGAGACPR